MKILVLSDIHGNISLAERIIEREKPQEVIFLGDGLRDIKESARFFRDIRFHFVQGNCDFYGDEDERYITLGGKNIFFTHGHRYNVKMEAELRYITLRSRAAVYEAQIVLFGHTHRPELIYADGRILMNPGAAMAGKYGVITTEADQVYPELKSI